MTVLDPNLTLRRLITGLPDLDAGRLVPFRDNLALAIDGGLAPATIRALHADGRRFADWCTRHGASWLPATPATVAAFLKDMAATGKVITRRDGTTTQAGYRPATLDRFAFSIRTWHLLAELEPPTRTTKVKMVRKAHARAVGRAQGQATGLGRDRLEPIIAMLADEAAEIEALAAPTPAQRVRRLMALRDSALLQTGYCILARGGELLALRWDDILPDGQGQTIAVIRRSKTDQDGLGAKQHLWPRVVAALRAWQQAHDQELARFRDEEGRRVAGLRAFRDRPRQRFHPRILLERREPAGLLWVETPLVFRGLGPASVTAPSGERRRYGWPPSLSLRSLNDIIAARALAATLPPGNYSSHSLRIGAAQDLLAAGKSLAAIMEDGRWTSPEMVLRYVRHLLASRGAMAEWGREAVAADNRAVSDQHA